MKTSEAKQKLDWLRWLAMAVLFCFGIFMSAYFPQNHPLVLGGWLFLAVVLLFLAYHTRPGQLLLKFGRESSVEMRKVVWPTRKETLQITRMVIIMVVVIAIILWGVDFCSSWVIGWITGQRG